MIICEGCIEALRSHGDIVVIDDVFSDEDSLEMELECEFCKDANTDLRSVHFPAH